MSQIVITNIIRQLRELQEGSLWFDQCLKDKIAGLTDEEAFTRPIPEIHSVAEHISHILEWRKECLRRFNMQRTELMNSPDDWKDNDTLRKTGWSELKGLLFDSTEVLIQALENQDDSFLETNFKGTDYNFHYIIEGILQHDLYHLGQMGITIKLLRGQ
jgi:uncharacterized damage-inducible protein DinB